METRSKAQRDTVGADATGSGFMSGQGETHPTCDPSPPVLTPVGTRATPVLMEESSDDAEQHQEHTDLQHRLEISTIVTKLSLNLYMLYTIQCTKTFFLSR